MSVANLGNVVNGAVKRVTTVNPVDLFNWQWKLITAIIITINISISSVINGCAEVTSGGVCSSSAMCSTTVSITY